MGRRFRALLRTYFRLKAVELATGSLVKVKIIHVLVNGEHGVFPARGHDEG
jgi:hypothetical protein